MNFTSLGALTATAAFIALVHTLIGPDHYIPFVAMSRAGRWSMPRTLTVTGLCGVGHVLSSVLLGGIGIALGTAVERLRWVESLRGNVAGWVLLGFGLAYTAWGIRRAIRNRPHTHAHVHADGTVHVHPHAHVADHAHAHIAHERNRDAPAPSLTPWVLFTIFVFGPCEPLIPLVMYPALKHNWVGVAIVTAVFGFITIGTMLTVVALATLGLTRLGSPRLERYTHALAGVALVACGLAVTLGL
ncbi:MAG: sulfite exporter TauE/SafE family protein [Phycisphaerae bacterium]